MILKEKMLDGIKTIKEETHKQVEKTKEAIENSTPNQLESNLERCDKDILKYNDLTD